MQPDDEQVDYNKPVAYDSEGRPLYAHPPSVVDIPNHNDHKRYDTKSNNEEVRWQHDKSVKQYPSLNLSENEYVIREFQRNPIGLVPAVSFGSIIILLIVFGLMNYSFFVPSGNPPVTSLFLPAFLLIVLVALITYISVVVYMSNKFYLTNESVIQENQTTLFARQEQTLGLSNIEDVSFTKTGIFPMVFGYGTIRLSTEGEETTYHFKYVSNPKQEVATIQNAVEKFKHGKQRGED